MHATDVTEERVTRTFRHGWFGLLVMLAFFAAPLALAVVKHADAAALARGLPWFAWLAVAPVAVVVGGVWLLCLGALLDILRSSFRATNWLVKTTDEGLYLHLRSYQNRHFPDDAPTVAFLRYAEIASVAPVRESYERGHSTHNLGWVELTLANVDTAELAARIEHERTCPAPEGRFLGIRGSTRSNHVPVWVSAPGVVCVERVSRGLVRELGRHVETSAPRQVDLERADGRDLETRVRELLARGERLGAIQLARKTRNLSLTAAHQLVQEIERGPASTQHAA